MEVPKNKDKLLSKLRGEHNTEEKDGKYLKPKKTNMAKILKGVVQFPEKLHVAGPIGEERAKPTAPRENPEHGKEGKEFSGK